MNHDEKNPDLQAWIAPELEARLVAAVLGEASAFELSELERLMAEKPELAIFKRRIEAVHGLVGAAVRPEQAPLRLAPERRAKILQTIGATTARAPGADTNAPVLVQLAKAGRKRRKKWIWATSMAASLMFAAILALKVLPSAEFKLGPSRPDPAQTVLGGRGTTAGKGAALQWIQGTVDDKVELSERFAESKPSIVSSLRKALTSSPDSSEARSVNKEVAKVELPSSTDSLVAGAKMQTEDAQKKGEVEGVLRRKDTRAMQRQGQAAAADQGKVRTIVYDAPARGIGGREQLAQQKAPTPAAPSLRGALQPELTFGLGASAAANERHYAFGGKAGAGTATDGYAKSPNQGFDFDKVSPAPAAAAYVKSLNQLVYQPSSAPAATAVPAVTTDATTMVLRDEVVTLSPFTVSKGSDRGYHVSSTLAGTRLNSTLGGPAKDDLADGDFLKNKLSDIAGSITVVTKEHFQDRASVDLNDIFRYEANTEGARGPSSFLETDSKPTSAALEDQKLSQEKAATAAPPPAEPPAESVRAEISAARESVSTFSLHVSDVSFRLAQAALARGEVPDPERIRPEEFYNAFDYGDPSPAASDKISCRIEQSAHPVLQQRNLVRIAMKVPAAGRGAGQPLHLTVLLDTSGSMEREDRIASVRRALEVLASLLGANDRVTLIGFARQPRLIVEHLSGDQAAQLVQLAASTPFTGGTNIEEALKLAGELARRHRDPAAQNRIVLLTDGAANLGNADPAQLTKMIETLRQQGLAFDACGIGTDGLDDTILEALTRKGDGRYYVIDKPEDADTGFARQLAGAFRPAAENVKVQVRFNPARVGRYRLIGFEQHRLREEDFRNDKVDAAELAAEEAAVAVYQVEVLPQGEGELGEVFVRFRDPANSNMVERSWTMLHEPQARAFDRATPTMQLAGMAALMAEKLQGGEAARAIELGDLTPVVNALRGHYANSTRVQELAAMFEQMRRMEGK